MIDVRKRLIFMNMLVDTIGWSLLIPTLPGLYNNFRMTNVSIGAISSFLSLLVFICGTLQGKASDYFGRTRMLQVSAVAQLAGHALIIFAVRIESFYLFVLARCFPSLLKCGMVVSQAFLYDISRTEDISKDIGTLMAFSNMAFIVGPILGGYAYSVHSELPFLIGVFLAAVSMMILLKLDSLMNKSSTALQQPSPKVTKSHAIPRNIASSVDHAEGASSFLHYLHMKFAFQVGNSLYEALFAQHVKNQLGMNGSQIGLLLGFTGALSAVTNGVLLKIILGAVQFPEYLVWMFAVGLGCGLVGWALSTSLWTLIVSVVLITVSSNLFLSILQSVIAQSQKYAEVRGQLQVRMYASWREEKLFELGSPQYQQESQQPLVHSQSLESIGAADGVDDVTTGDEGDSTDCESDEMNYEDTWRDVGASPRSSNTVFHRSLEQRSDARKKLIRNSNTVNDATTDSRSVGVVFGMSSAADRAARILSPLLGGLLLEQYGNMGLVYMAVGAAMYCFTLVITCMPDRHIQHEMMLRHEAKLQEMKKTI